MNAKELRLDNLVLWDNEIVPIDLIMTETVNVRHKDSFIDWYTVDIEDIEPIELTEEWLIKFGFENNFKQYELMNWGLKVDLLNNEWIVFHGFCGKYSEITSCRYVHQLQNLYFALTGKELTI